MNRSSFRALSLAMLVATAPAAVQAAGDDGVAAKEAGIASAHAGMASSAKDLTTTRMHLHHVINCLVGPTGDGFDANEENPCKGVGHGAIVDAGADAVMQARLQTALSEARLGLSAATLDAAHQDAQAAMKALQAK